jgi:hypothetical protein
MKKLILMFTVLTLVLLPMAAMAVTFTTPTGATNLQGNPVDAQADFTLGNDTLTIVLTNLLINPKAVDQNISDLFFDFGNDALTTASLVSSSGVERTVASNGTYTPGSAVSTGWVLSTVGTGFKLDGLGTATFVPAHTIIGEPDLADVYSNANASIAGNGPHNPFLYGPVSFTLNVSGLTPSDTIKDVVFSFGTTPGNNVAPIPGSLLLLGSGIMGLVGIGIRRKSS